MPETVATFLANHQDIAQALALAGPHLKRYFGTDSLINFEVSTDDDGLGRLCAVVAWTGEVSLAAQSLEAFVESWALDHPTPGLAFTYEIHPMD